MWTWVRHVPSRSWNLHRHLLPDLSPSSEDIVEANPHQLAPTIGIATIGFRHPGGIPQSSMAAITSGPVHHLQHADCIWPGSPNVNDGGYCCRRLGRHNLGKRLSYAHRSCPVIGCAARPPIRHHPMPPAGHVTSAECPPTWGIGAQLNVFLRLGMGEQVEETRGRFGVSDASDAVERTGLELLRRILAGDAAPSALPCRCRRHSGAAGRRASSMDPQWIPAGFPVSPASDEASTPQLIFPHLL
jgi:hypothetical protein